MAIISKRVSGAWQNASYGIRATATDTITTLPTTIYGDGTNATITLKGNTEQNSTPSPSNPVPVAGVGELDNGQYKISILSNSTTTPVYLSEVQTTRKIRKWVLTGEETSWYMSSGFMYNDTIQPDYLRSTATTLICSHYKAIGGVTGGGDVSNWQCGLYRFASVQRIYIRDNNYSTVEDFKTYLQQQYAVGTPVTIWYVLATEETAVINEPLMKIAGYADEVNKISIPTTDGANTLSVDTTVQPSEVSINYHGWHMGTVHERVSGDWD